MLPGQFQNITIEERVEILEGQVVIIQNRVSDTETDVDFLFDEQIIQDERLFSLEEETKEINDQLFVIDDNVESKCCYRNIYICTGRIRLIRILSSATFLFE